MQIDTVQALFYCKINKKKYSGFPPFSYQVHGKFLHLKSKFEQKFLFEVLFMA